ncbi:MAG: porphobilinogen synthase [bacterium]|nr:porphobilinogen synthase [bacterium]
MDFPFYRPRRLRRSEDLRRLIRETRVSIDDLIMPYFVVHGKEVKEEIHSMPGNFRFSVDELVKEIKEVKQLGIPAILLFGIPNKKDEKAREAYAKDGIIQQAISAIKDSVPDIIVITDVCLCGYMSHGHCGIVENGEILNDPTLELLAKTALSHVEAGADMVAPSDMMDGRVRAIRRVLDENGFSHIPIMAYSAKYASSFYGPFREAVFSTPAFGDRSSYQMDPANSDEGLREVRQDISEGADIVMVKPALAYLDVIYRVKKEFSYPVAAYNVSGEYSMIKAADKMGWIDGKKVTLEILTSIKRAGADMILTYFAKQVAKWLR